MWTEGLKGFWRACRLFGYSFGELPEADVDLLAARGDMLPTSQDWVPYFMGAMTVRGLDPERIKGLWDEKGFLFAVFSESQDFTQMVVWTPASDSLVVCVYSEEGRNMTAAHFSEPGLYQVITRGDYCPLVIPMVRLVRRCMGASHALEVIALIKKEARS